MLEIQLLSKKSLFLNNAKKQIFNHDQYKNSITIKFYLLVYQYCIQKELTMDEEQKKLAEELLFSGNEAPTFAKQLYFGKIDTSQLFPYPSTSDEEKENTQQFLSKLKEYVDENLDPDAIDRNAMIPKELIQGLGDIGLLGMTVPKKYGGLEMSQNAYCQAIEIIAQKCGGTAVFTNAHQSIGLRGIFLFGNDKQKDKWLPDLSNGKKIAAFSLTEPNAGSDAAGVETKAVYDPEKKVYRINGNKQWTTNGSIAQVLTLMAKTEVDTKNGKKEKVTAFLVTPDMPGFKITNPGLEKVGIKGTRTTNFELTDLEVPEENILGPLGGGLRVCLTCLDYGRITFGAMCTGVSKYCVNRAIDHATTRHQFNRPLASFPLVKDKIANMAALSYAMDATTYLTAGFIDNGIEDVMLESAILKVFASDALWQILYDTMQIFGGRSFFTSEPFERMMRDARLNMIGEGSNEVLRAFIGVVGMRDVGMQLKSITESLSNPIGNLNSLWHAFGDITGRVRLAVLEIESDHLQKEKKLYVKNLRRFGIDIIKLLAKHREDIIEQQLQLNRIANCAIALYTTAAVLSKLDTELKAVRNKAHHLGNDLAIGKHYCKRAFNIMDINHKGIYNNFDGEVEALSDQLTGI
jgi:acyl-CoA dehydrogenase family member 9